MKKFKFRFDTILKVKEKKEEKLKRELFKLNALKLEQEKVLKEILNTKDKITRQKAKAKEAGTSLQTIIFYEEYLNSLRRNILNTEKKIKELEEMADKKRKEVIEASKEKKIFERLKEREFLEFKKIVLTNEQKVLDEIAINRFNRGEQHSV